MDCGRNGLERLTIQSMRWYGFHQRDAAKIRQPCFDRCLVWAARLYGSVFGSCSITASSDVTDADRLSSLAAQGRARPSLAELYNWRYRQLGNLPNVLTQPAFLRANPGFAYDYQFVDVPEYMVRPSAGWKPTARQRKWM